MIHCYCENIFSVHFCHFCFSQGSWYHKTRVIVDYDRLIDVLAYCVRCCSPCIVDGEFSGAGVIVAITCLNHMCQHTGKWSSPCCWLSLHCIMKCYDILLVSDPGPAAFTLARCQSLTPSSVVPSFLTEE